jgi:hypothetical protein
VEPTIEYRREDTNIEHEFFAIALTEMKRRSRDPGPLTVTLRKSQHPKLGLRCADFGLGGH